MAEPFGVNSVILISTLDALEQVHGHRIADHASLAMIHQGLSQVEDVWRSMATLEPAPLARAEQVAA